MSRSEDAPGRRRPVGLIALAAVLALEAVGAALLALLALSSPGSGGGVTSGVAVAVFIVLIAALLALTAVGTYRAQAWTRAACLVWQLVQLLVGAYSLQGAGAATGFGVTAIGLAVVALVLLFTRPVRDATVRA